MVKMNIVRSGWWSWIFIGGLLLTFLVSVWLVLLNGVKLPSHPGIFDFIPLLLWLIVSFVWVSKLGSAEQQGTQRAGAFASVALIAFWAAFLLSALSLREKSFFILFLAMLAFYVLTALSWHLLRKYLHNEFHVDLWRLPHFWGLVALLLLDVFLTTFVYSLFGSFISMIVFIVVLGLIHLGLGRFLIHHLQQSKVMNAIILLLGLLALSTILWTFIFIFLGYVLV